MQRSAVVPGADFFLRPARLLESQVRRHPRVRIQFRPKLFAARDVALRQLDRGQLFRFNFFGEFHHR